ncbi:hypothetical protein KBD69_03525 [Candidatus Woesebacteria bacterium]|nr:hypothetical protein [Candidatus Woesebacteria bacterium]
MSGDTVKHDIDQGVGQSTRVDVVIDNPERESNSNKLGDEILWFVKTRDIVPYFAAFFYGFWENTRAVDSWGDDLWQNQRLQEGIQRLFDMNTGDGTIAALGFMFSELISRRIDKKLKESGHSGIDPIKRFVGSVGVGVFLAGWLETTTIFNNTIDIPGDFFGTLLLAASVLASKSITDAVADGKLSKSLDFLGNFIGKRSERSEIESMIAASEDLIMPDEVESKLLAIETRETYQSDDS